MFSDRGYKATPKIQKRRFYSVHSFNRSGLSRDFLYRRSCNEHFFLMWNIYIIYVYIHTNTLCSSYEWTLNHSSIYLGNNPWTLISFGQPQLQKNQPTFQVHFPCSAESILFKLRLSTSSSSNYHIFRIPSCRHFLPTQDVTSSISGCNYRHHSEASLNHGNQPLLAMLTGACCHLVVEIAHYLVTLYSPPLFWSMICCNAPLFLSLSRSLSCSQVSPYHDPRLSRPRPFWGHVGRFAKASGCCCRQRRSSRPRRRQLRRTSHVHGIWVATLSGWPTNVTSQNS